MYQYTYTKICPHPTLTHTIPHSLFPNMLKISLSLSLSWRLNGDNVDSGNNWNQNSIETTLELRIQVCMCVRVCVVYACCVCA